MIFRDDDISLTTYRERFDRFRAADRLFQHYRVPHTIAVIAKDMDHAMPLVHYIRSHPHIQVQLHCWEHIDFTQYHSVLEQHIRQGIDMLTWLFGTRPTTLYPPWNRTDPTVNSIAAAAGLEVSHRKTSLDAYINDRAGDISTINFHYWAPHETALLEPALKKYTSTNTAA